MDKQIVYILSTNYAGSHFLALQLGSHSGCVSVGELHHFRWGAHKRPRACKQCETDTDCPVLKGLDDIPVSQYYSKIFENLSAYNSKATTLIENSKKPRWAAHFLNSREFRMKYIHLIRDPRALIRRWMLDEKDFWEQTKTRWRTARRCRRHAWEILRGDPINVYLWKWLYQNKCITRFINDNHLDAQLVTYHDLVFEPDRILSDLMRWIGFEYQPAQKEYWKFVHHGSFKSMYMQPPSDGSRVFDQRWKSFLPESAQQAAVNHEYVNAYIKEINLMYDPKEGLINHNVEISFCIKR